jgi:3-hydroxyisobutyrate dehydrogenase-like beta-hydroxyacid dehydrogenase
VSAAATFALLGLGEAGTAIAADLVAAGATVRGWDPVREAPAGVVQAADERDAVRNAAIVLSLNSAAVAVEAAAAAAPGLGAEAVYADLNTAAPAVKRAAAEAAGAAFADVALLGPVPGNGVRTPALVSGPGASRFAAALGPLGMPVTDLGPEIGAASARKLARSVFAKGLAAAVGESLEAARRLGCEDWLHAELEAALTAADARYLARLIEGSLTHSGRRAEEMAAAVALLEELGVEPRVAGASEAWLRSLGHSEVGR